VNLSQYGGRKKGDAEVRSRTIHGVLEREEQGGILESFLMQGTTGLTKAEAGMISIQEKVWRGILGQSFTGVGDTNISSGPATASIVLPKWEKELGRPASIF